MTSISEPHIHAAAPQRRLTGSMIALLAGLAAIGALSTNIILPSFPSLAAQFDEDGRNLSALLSSFFIAFAIGQLFVGPLSDRFGRRPLVLFGLFVFIAGTILCGTAETFPTMIAGRIIQALGVCAASVLSRAIARDLFEGEALARALSLTMIAMAAAPGFSPLLGSALDIFFGWRATFAFVGVAAVALGLAYFFGMGETHPQDRRAAHSAQAIARSYATLAFDGRFILPALAVSLVVGALYAFFGAAPSILVKEIGLTSLQLGLFFAATVFVVFAGGFLAPRLAHRFGPARSALGGAVAAMLGGGLLATGGQDPDFSTFSGAIVVFLLGMGILNPLGTALCLQPFGKKAGIASALLGFLQMAFAAIGTALATNLQMPPMAALGWVIGAAATLSIFAFMAWLSLPSRKNQVF